MFCSCAGEEGRAKYITSTYRLLSHPSVCLIGVVLFVSFLQNKNRDRDDRDDRCLTTHPTHPMLSMDVSNDVMRGQTLNGVIDPLDPNWIIAWYPILFAFPSINACLHDKYSFCEAFGASSAEDMNLSDPGCGA